jgi:MraZ protein
MLTGHYDHTIDEKSRLTLPARFRESFAEGIVLAPGLDGCVHAYTRRDWDRIVETRLGTLDPLSRDDRRMQRFFFASAVEAELDKQGRVMVPASLTGPAGLGREVVVAGIYDHLEIWDRTAWRKEMDEVEGSAEHVAERLAQKRD